MSNMPYDFYRKGFEEFRQYVNPFIAERAQLAREPMNITGSREGKLLVDGSVEIENFHGTQAFGHRRPEITVALKEYLDTDYPEWYPSRVSPFAGRLAKILCERSGYSQVYFGLSGSDGIEAAIKLIRAYSRKPGILSLEGGYHGCNVGSTAMMSKGYMHDAFGPHLPGVRQLPFNDVDALKKEFAQGDVGGIIVEPIQGEGGVRALSDDYVAAICELTDREDCLLVADEIQTGMGRTGNFLKSAKWPRKPDVAVVAKQLGGGIMPVSAVMTDMAIFKRAYGTNFALGESHNMTFSYNSMGMVAGIATLKLLTDEYIEEIREKGEWFNGLLRESLSGSPLFEELRGEGMMLGVKLKNFSNPWVSYEQFGFKDLDDMSLASPLLARRMYQHNYFCFTCGHDWSVFRLQPRYDIERSKLEDFARLLRQELDKLDELN